MNPEKDSDPLQPLPSETGPDAILTDFLDREIGIPSGATELSPDLDRKLSQTLKEIGLLPDTPSSQTLSALPDDPVIDTIQPDRPATIEVFQHQAETLDPSSPQAHPGSTLTDYAAPDPIEDLERTIQTVVKSREADQPRLTNLFITVGVVLAITAGVAAYFLLWQPGSQSHNSGTTASHLTPPLQQGPENVQPEASTAPVQEGGVSKPSSEVSTPNVQAKQGVDPLGSEVGKSLENTMSVRTESTKDMLAPVSRSRPEASETNAAASSLRDSESAPSLSANLLPMVPVPDSAVAVPIKDIALPRSSLPSVGHGVPPPPVRSIATEGPGVVTIDMAIRRANPVYPEIARRMKASGTVEVEFWTNAEGKVLRTRAVTGPPTLRGASQEALMKWRFKPLVSAGGSIPGHGKLVFVFKSEN